MKLWLAPHYLWLVETFGREKFDESPINFVNIFPHQIIQYSILT